ncbi:hypothetical protein [Vibrio anguillarum]|uniref:hypothetical protein n=1 Tax=Vibrio anguillarum TaxID=55601 RepID=UPI00097E327E|nr:hypothetical protein [Vibrio anguillarum]AQM21431.1 hypothetical protein PN51_16645 [Vibrio anguillarum]AUB86202.1 hypothetical protein CKY00_02495 [Vibrio anguillarum]AUB89640.1 hypothetical protein CKX99_02495 [Vibrio anguillarum]AUB93082.1 hypothetical protein CK210_02495 [Vibrio anguillarum]AUB96514.1 hypothetical protein CK209_02495 [Vibrio anguillarum]
MKFIANTNRKKRISIVVLFIALFFLGSDYYQISQPNIWGDEPDESYITISGKKPIDTKIDAWVGWGASGSNCKARTFSFSNVKWSKGANVDLHITYDFSADPNRYELRMPYQKYYDALNCDVTLGDIIVQAYNAFDTVGFAQLRIYSPNSADDKFLPFSSLIEAKDCNGDIFKSIRKEWAGAIGCHFYVDGKKKTKDEEFNAYTVYYDFSKFNNGTVIHYDILAGENYRSEPLVQEQAAVAQ